MPVSVRLGQHIDLPSDNGGLVYDRRQQRWYRLGHPQLMVLRELGNPDPRVSDLGLDASLVQQTIRRATEAGFLQDDHPHKQSRWRRTGWMLRLSLGDPHKLLV